MPAYDNDKAQGGGVLWFPTVKEQPKEGHTLRGLVSPPHMVSLVNGIPCARILEPSLQ